MVLGLSNQATLPKQVKPGVADVRPVRVICLHDASHAGRTLRFQLLELICVRAERLVRSLHRILQEFKRVLKGRFRLLLETFDEEPYRDLRGNLASSVPAHSVGENQQQCLAAIGIGEPILVDLARALEAFLEDCETHYITSLNSRFLSESKKVNLRLRGAISRIAFCSAKTLCGRSSGSSRKHQSMTSSRLSE